MKILIQRNLFLCTFMDLIYKYDFRDSKIHQPQWMYTPFVLNFKVWKLNLEFTMTLKIFILVNNSLYSKLIIANDCSFINQSINQLFVHQPKLMIRSYIFVALENTSLLYLVLFF